MRTKKTVEYEDDIISIRILCCYKASGYTRTYQFTYEVKWLPGVVYQIMRQGQYLLSWKLKNGISLIPICWLIWRLNSWGKQAIFNLGIKKKSGLSINPGIHHTKVFSSVRIWRNCVFAANSNFQIATCRWCKLLIFQT